MSGFYLFVKNSVIYIGMLREVALLLQKFQKTYIQSELQTHRLQVVALQNSNPKLYLKGAFKISESFPWKELRWSSFSVICWPSDYSIQPCVFYKLQKFSRWRLLLTSFLLQKTLIDSLQSSCSKQLFKYSPRKAYKCI